MQEPAGGGGHGRRLSDKPEVEGRHLPLAVAGWQGAEFMRASGWLVVHTETAHHASAAGARSHAANQHTVLHPDEYVDDDLVVALVEDELGFTVEQIHSVYCTGGRIPSARIALRDAIDARLLDVLRAGGNLAELGRRLGLEHKAVERAVARAKSKEDS